MIYPFLTIYTPNINIPKLQSLSQTTHQGAGAIAGVNLLPNAEEYAAITCAVPVACVWNSTRPAFQ